jgi:hypothetical protein
MRIINFAKVQTGSESHPPSFEWAPGALSSFVNLLGCEYDHSSPCGDHVKNVWGYISRLPYASKAWCLAQNGKYVAGHILLHKVFCQLRGYIFPIFIFAGILTVT